MGKLARNNRPANALGHHPPVMRSGQAQALERSVG